MNKQAKFFWKKKKKKRKKEQATGGDLRRVPVPPARCDGDVPLTVCRVDGVRVRHGAAGVRPPHAAAAVGAGNPSQQLVIS
jgi:hypothetical protein